MKKLLLLSTFLILFSCAQKVHFFEAQKRGGYELKDSLVRVDSYFAGDALEYIVFELDVENLGDDAIELSAKDIRLEVYDHSNRDPLILDALNKRDVINDLHRAQKRLKAEKKTNDILNAVDIGLSLLVIGTSGTYTSVDAIIYSTETAAYMMEDARAYKLMKGDIEDQIQYVEDWVMDDEYIEPHGKGSWDVLFPRQLFNAPSSFVLHTPDFIYKQDFDLYIKEEKVC